MKFSLDIENTHFYIWEEDKESEDELLIINDYKNLIGIDLDTSNIKQKPAKFFYFFDNVWKKNREYAQILNNFIGSSRAFENPLFFDIDKYLNNG